MKISRRTVLKYGSCGMAAVALGAFKVPFVGVTPAKAQTLGTFTANLSMEEADVEMVDGTLVYHWLFKAEGNMDPSFPGPVVFAFTGETVTLNVTNNLDEIHEFRIVAAGPNGTDLDTGPIAPGQTATLTFVAPAGGTYMYLDPRNAPVNRVLGLHGAFIVLPQTALTAMPGPGLRFADPAPTPYSNPTRAVQRLFNDLSTPLFNVRPDEPGQSWVPVRPHGAPIPFIFEHAMHLHQMTHDDFMLLGMMEPFLFRSRIWVFLGIDPQFNAIAEAGGTAEPGAGINPTTFKTQFLARYFTINGKSGVYSTTTHVAPETALVGFIGQPHVVRLLNAGLHTCSPHLHANHFYVLAVNNVVMENIVKPDTMTVTSQETEIPASALPSNPLAASQKLLLHGGSRVDWLVPCKRPPDIPHDPTLLLEDVISEELSLIIGDVPQSPLSYPMHSHMELDNTAAGGNYPQGMTTHFEFLGELINGEEVHFPNSHAHIDLPGGENGDHEH